MTIWLLYTVKPKKKCNWTAVDEEPHTSREKEKTKRKIVPKKKSLSYRYFPLMIFSLVKPLKINLNPVIFTIYSFIERQLPRHPFSNKRKNSNNKKVQKCG